MENLVQGPEDQSQKSEENIPKMSKCYCFLFLHCVLKRKAEGFVTIEYKLFKIQEDI